MADNNFKCKGCEKEFFIPEYSFNGLEYKGKDRKPLTCDCEKQDNLIPIDKPFNGFPTGSTRFSSMSPQQKQQHLKERSKKHSKIHVANPRDI